MNNKKENTLLIILIAIGLCIVVLIITSEIKSDNKIEKNAKQNTSVINSSNIDKEDTNLEIKSNTDKKVEENEKDDNLNNIDSKVESETANKNHVTNNEPIKLSDNDKTIISKFESIETSTDKLLSEKEDKTVGDKLKGIFITIVDFLFYDTEIDGVTFDELTENGKQEVLKIANAIDEKIENKFPDYKETISGKTKNAFNKASELIKKGANNINEFSREKLGEENYNSIINAKDELIKYTKNAFEIIGDIGSELFNKASSSIKNWYEKFRDNNS